jgi:hypothetical protein
MDRLHAQIMQSFCRYQGSGYECATWLSTGGMLSLLLWNMTADSLLNRLVNCNCFVQGVADDVVILISEKLFSTICDLMQRALNCVKTGVVK